MREEKTKRIIRREYSRDNLGSYYWEEEMKYLHQVADEIEKYFINDEIDKIIEILDNSGIEYEIDEENEQIILYDNLLSHRGSEGYCEVTLIRVDEEETETKRLRELSEKYITGKYEIVSIDKGNFAIGCVFRDYEEGDIVTAEELKQLIEEFCLYIENVTEDPAILYGYESDCVPVCSNNSYAMSGDSFDFEVSEDEVILETEYTSLCGAHHHIFSEYIHLKKIKE